MFNVYNLDAAPDTYDIYPDGAFLKVNGGTVYNVVYTDNKKKMAYALPDVLVHTLIKKYYNKRQLTALEILKELSGKYSADDIIKFKTNKLI